MYSQHSSKYQYPKRISIGGFSLVELLIVASLGIVVMGGTLKILQISLQSSQLSRASLAEQELQIAVAQALKSGSDQCKANLRPKDGSDGNLDGSDKEKGIGSLTALKKGTHVLLESGVSFKNSLDIVKMSLTGDATKDPKGGSPVETL